MPFDHGQAQVRRYRFIPALLLSAALVGAGASAYAEDEDTVTAPVATASLPSAAAPAVEESVRLQILSEADAEIYQQIFAAQENGDWRIADTLIRKVDDKLLLGALQAQRYLHPRYKPTAEELKSWMDSFHDQGDARAIHKAAHPAKGKAPKGLRAPSGGYLVGGGHSGERIYGAPKAPAKRLSAAEKAEAEKLMGKVAALSRKGATKNVRGVLEEDRAKSLLSTVDYDRYRLKLGTGYFVDGLDDKALEWVLPVAQRSGAYIPDAHWIAGLSYWRMGRLDEAGRQFERAAEVAGQSQWAISAAAFWAARTYMISGRPEKVNRWLSKAASYPRTFYGILAARVQGHPLPFNWEVPALTAELAAGLAATPQGKRALALLQVGRTETADQELRILAASAGDETRRDILVVAMHYNLAGLAMRLDNILHRDNGGFDAAAFPLMNWNAPGGSKADRALVFAIVRQESGFNPRAQSPAGAQGLMQIMPGTASFVANDRRYRGKNRSDLLDADLNLYLGQKLIGRLLDDPAVQGDMFQLAAAWNGGSGNLDRWVRRGNHQDDPLLFIESIPVRETREFIEKILTNLWVYRHRLGQAIPELDAIASGERPIYTRLDESMVVVAENGED
ncbi:MAG: lytic transglycosylase domain-containing protein [Magnetospirillum sp. WYHS-4]